MPTSDWHYSANRRSTWISGERCRRVGGYVGLRFLFDLALRKFVDAKLDEVIDELKKEALLPPTTDEGVSQSAEPDEPVLEPPMTGVQLTLEILSLDGRSLYQHTEGSSSAGRVG